MARFACWGNSSADRTAPPAGTDFMEVAAGEAHGCALRVDGTLACWGWHNLGQAEPPAGNFSQVATGRSHSCAVRMDGSIACWGRNESGQSAPPNGTAF